MIMHPSAEVERISTRCQAFVLALYRGYFYNEMRCINLRFTYLLTYIRRLRFVFALK